MADTNRHLFGGSIADYAVAAGTTIDDEALKLVPGSEVTFWNQQTGGTQITDLAAGPDGTGPTDMTTSSDGTDGWPVGELVPIYGPEGVKAMWAEADGGPRVLVVCCDLGDAIDDIYAQLDFIAPLAALPDLLPFSVVGDLVTMVGKHHLFNDYGAARTISSVRAHVGTAPIGAPVQIDVKINGVSIFASAGDRPTIASGDTDALNGLISHGLWAEGGDLTVSVTSVGSATPGADLTIAIWVV